MLEHVRNQKTGYTFLEHVLERAQIGWNHPIYNKSLRIIKPEHVLTGKVYKLFEDHALTF
jgi:hypothetical protein